MGLISAALGAASGVMADQWKEYFYCEAMDKDTLVCKGHHRVSEKSTNYKGSDNIISNGSIISVADGQCMIIVDNGKVVEFCAEPGEFKYDSSTEPSLFSGSLGKGIIETFKNIGKRFTFGGEPPKDQRVYYFNTKELVGNKYGTPNKIPFRVVDTRANIDIDVNIACFGEYSYRICDPILFYTNVCGNVAEEFDRSEIDSQLKTELLTALQPAFAKIGEQGIRYSALPAHTMEMADALNDVLSAKWSGLRGIEIVSFGVSSVKADEEDERYYKELQRNVTLRDPNAAAAQIVSAQAQAMKDAANNTAGAMTGFMGMGMAQQAGGVNAASLFQMGAQQQAAAPAAPAADSWTCSCGTVNTGKFCNNCGTAKPAPAGSWTCSCGTVNTGKFCSNCGTAKPAPAGAWTCSCGTENTGNFCNNCGKPRA